MGLKPQKSMKKGLTIGLSVAAAVVLIGVAALVFWPKAGYRTIQIYQLDGEAELKREEKVISPYVNMMLVSEDHVTTFEECFLYLKMDEDKYMLAEPETKFRITAAGSPENSRTEIELESGAVVQHVMEPLSDKSSYEVHTPNSTMAVRGTSFRVYVWYDSAGVSHTMLQVFEGVVGVRLRYPDGTMSEEERLFTMGMTVTIWGDDATSEYDEEDYGIDYISMYIETLEFLKIGPLGLPEYHISVDELEEIIILKQTYFSVTFMANDQVFGTQSVLFNQFAERPTIRPSIYGAWDYDFSIPIRQNTVITWTR